MIPAEISVDLQRIKELENVLWGYAVKYRIEGSIEIAGFLQDASYHTKQAIEKLKDLRDK